MSAVPAFMLQPIALAAADEYVKEAPAAGEFVPREEEPPPREPPPPFVPGVYPDMPAPQYHRTEAIGSGGLKKLLQSCMHFRAERDRPSQETSFKQFGIAVHAGTLEPDTFANRVVAMPALNLRKPSDRETAAAFIAEHRDAIVLSLPDYRRCLDTVAAIRAHPSAMKLLAGAEVELSFMWNDGRYGVPCKARWDARNFGLAIDLKTCQDASPEGFARTMASFKYHAQAGHYCSASEHLLNESPEAFVFIAAESEPPHGVAVYRLNPAAIAEGMNLADIAYARYRDAIAANEWRGYSDRIEIINLPGWAFKRREAA